MKMQKRQFRIGELAEHLGVEKFVVRFWEKEFNLGAHRSQGGQRFYEESDLERFQCIKKLLYEQKFTIAGAKKKLRETPVQMIASKKTSSLSGTQLAPSTLQHLKIIKEQLISLQELLIKEFSCK